MSMHPNAAISFDDALLCNEEKWGEIITPPQENENEGEKTNLFSIFSPLVLLQQDLFWDDEELKSLFVKEKQTSTCCYYNKKAESLLLDARRKEAVDWILRVNARYGFAALTSVLAVNYLDRFVNSLGFVSDERKPWMMQLVAVTCLSLAAKVEETHVPLLLDLQVEGAEYVFETKTIQRMELLVLSSLKWRMNPVTPLSFLDHIIRRLGLKNYGQFEFLQSCENLLLSVVSDARFVQYLPSVLATATMLHVIYKVEPCNAVDYENQLLLVLEINKDEVDECYELISEIVSNSTLKRKFCTSDVSNGAMYNSDSSNESWGVESCISSSSPPPHQPMYKKIRVQEQQMKLSRVFN